MASRDWFRCGKWDAATRDAFETRLARSRTPFHRAQYLYIQGVTLVETRKRREVSAGRTLLERVIEDYPDEHHQVAGAHYALANSYLREDRRSEAIEHLRLCLILEAGRHFSFRTELRLAEALLAGDPTDADLIEVGALLDESAANAFFHSERWRIAVALARAYAKRRNAGRAATHAREALALLADNTPKLPRHKNVGLIETDEGTVHEMQRLANPAED